jgi:hypothetical protein
LIPDPGLLYPYTVARVVKLLVVVVVLYFGVTQGLPWIRQRVEGVTQDKVEGRPDPSLDADDYCVRLAHQASAFVGQELRVLAPPPAENSGWVNAADDIERYVREAENACSCPEDACEVAGEALSQIRSLVADANDVLHGDTALVLDFARRQEEIDALLEQARVDAH